MIGRVIKEANEEFLAEVASTGMLEKVQEAMGWGHCPLPETFNMEADRTVDWDLLPDRRLLSCAGGASTFVVPAQLSIKRQKIAVALVRQHGSDRPESRLEVLSAVCLKKEYGLSEGDVLEVEIG